MKVNYVYKEFVVAEETIERKIGKEVAGRTVVSINYHQPAGEGDAHYCDVAFDDGSVERIFRPDEVDWKEGN